MVPRRKKGLAYVLFGALLLGLLVNEWLLIARSSVSWTSDTLPSFQPQAPHPQHPPHYQSLDRPESWVHCVGENWLRNTWVYQSCQFQHLCYADHRVQLYPAKPRYNYSHLSPYARSSTDPFSHYVSSSALQPTWVQSQRYRWFPDIVEDTEGGFVELPPSVVWIPISLDPVFLQRPSAILFDILLPVYTLTTLFGWQHLPILLTPLDNVTACLSRNDADDACYPPKLQPYLPLLHLANNVPNVMHSTRFCARRAAAGVGALTDHGTKRHGDRPADYQRSVNVGKGALLYAFRNYCLQNAGIVDKNPHSSWPLRIVWATKESDVTHARFQRQSAFLQTQDALSNRIQTNYVDLSKVPLLEQLRLAVSTTFWIAQVGEDSIPAFFMPRGGALILYYNNDESAKTGGRPTMLHWDLWNHASHLTVHWLPASTMTTDAGLEMLRRIVQLQVKDLQEKDGHSHSGSDALQVSALGHNLRWKSTESNSASSVHCLGDNFVKEQAPCYRSCLYRHLCLDVARREFQLELDHEQAALQKALSRTDQTFQVVATDINQTVMNGRNVRFSESLPWAPTVVGRQQGGYYELPDNVLWIPYILDASFAGNLGHFCWDFLLPFYTLLVMYGLDEKEKRYKLVLTSTDDTCRNTPSCGGLIRKFMPLIGTTEIYSVDNLMITSNDEVHRICSPHGASGIGMLTDHGATRHGQGFVDYQQVQNAGRGAHFYAFRNFMIRNLGIDEPDIVQRARHGVMFSVNSSANPSRRRSFDKQIAVTRERLGDKAFVSGTELARLSLEDQVKIILQLSVMVSTVGGSTATCMFLPRHASLVLYFVSDEDFVSKSPMKDFPTMMDFDFWNNASYLRVHWLPLGSMDDEFHSNFLVNLIASELAQTERFQANDNF